MWRRTLGRVESRGADRHGDAVPGEPWCHTGTKKRMKLRDVPDDVHAELSEAASSNRQSLRAYVVDRLTEAAQVARLGDYLATYETVSVRRGISRGRRRSGA